VLDAQYFGVAQRRQRVFAVSCAGADVERVASVLFELEGARGDSSPGGRAGEDAASGTGTGIAPTQLKQLVETVAANADAEPVVISELCCNSEAPVLYENHGQDSRITRCNSVAPTVAAKYGTGGGNAPIVRHGHLVRYLTPRECERLMGFPDDYTLVPVKRGKNGGMASNGPRYVALGNSMAVPCVRWICERIVANLVNV